MPGSSPRFPGSSSATSKSLRSCVPLWSRERWTLPIAEGLTPEALKALEGNPRFKVVRAETLRLQYLGMNMKPGSPFANPKVREAVRWAVNHSSGTSFGAAPSRSRPLSPGAFSVTTP